MIMLVSEVIVYIYMSWIVLQQVFSERRAVLDVTHDRKTRRSYFLPVLTIHDPFPHYSQFFSLLIEESAT